MNTPAFDRITRARSRLILSQPFYGTLALYLTLHESDDIPTMATDGSSLWFNPAFTLGLSESECVGVVAHEVSHCAYFHHTRRQNREPRLWNIAADFAINRDLL